MNTPLIIAGQFLQPTVNLGDLFALVPDEIVLSASTRDMVLTSYRRCLCGWVLRETFAQATGLDAEDVDLSEEWGFVYKKLAKQYGGAPEDWRAVFIGVTDYRAPVIEEAWTNRVLEALEIADAQPIVYNTRRPQIVLDADVYDALELSAFAFGGIGAGDYGTATTSSGKAFDLLSPYLQTEFNAPPMCAVGHAAFAGVAANWWRILPLGTINENDAAVVRINTRKGAESKYTRVTFEEWVGELNIRRGEVAQ